MSTTIRPSRRKTRTDKPSPVVANVHDWPAWQQHLRQRTTPRGWSSLWPKLTGSPLRWAIDSLAPDAQVAALLGTLERFAERPQNSATVIAELTMWRATLADGPASWQLGVAALAWSHAMPMLAQMVSVDSWVGLMQDLQKLAGDAVALQPIDNPLAHQLLSVELPLTLAYLFPELPECAAMVPQARKLWSWAAEEATDGEGFLPARHLPQTAALLACWTRSMAMAKALPDGSVDEDVQVQYEWLLRQTLRLAREEGGFCFAGATKTSDFASLVKAALAQTEDPDDHALAKAALAGGKDKPAAKKPKHGAKEKKSLPEPFVHSEWSNASLLRGSWALDAPRLAIAYDQQTVRCELYAHRHLLLAGQWQAHVVIDGWTWKTTNDWEEVCWHTDEDVVYLELETKLTDGWKLQRQIMLATKEKVVFLADCVLGEQPAKLEYRGVLPLATGTKFLPADETREGYLAGKRAQALVMPLALPEWRVESGHGELTAVAQGLELTQVQHGQRMLAPLWIDLHSERIRKECTWRQLTVAHQLTIQPRDVAVAYRAQVGKFQYALYRSLAPKANRTFLGQNVVNEFYAARFNANGTTDGILEIE